MADALSLCRDGWDACLHVDLLCHLGSSPLPNLGLSHDPLELGLMLFGGPVDYMTPIHIHIVGLRFLTRLSCDPLRGALSLLPELEESIVNEVASSEPAYCEPVLECPHATHG